VDAPGTAAVAPLPAPGRVTVAGADPVPASNQTGVVRQRVARTPVRVDPDAPERAGQRTPAARHAAQREAAQPEPQLLRQPVAWPSIAHGVAVPGAAAPRSSRTHSGGRPAKHAARHHADGDPAPPASPSPPGGAVQAATGAAGGGGAAPELPCILIVILATSGLPALQRQRIALVLRAPNACSRPLERPG
jgi:hypothetical protein